MAKSKLPAFLLLSVFCFCYAATGQTGSPPQQWISLSPAGNPPPARQAQSAVFDLQTDNMIVFGGTDGYCGSDCDFSDVWTLSFGANPQWTQITPYGNAPPARTGSSAAYDSGNSNLIIFGGGEGSSSPCENDTWVLSSANGIGYYLPEWFQLAPAGTPPAARIFHTAVYDPGSNRMIVFGGNNCFNEGAQYYNDTWILTNANGSGDDTPTWIQLTFTGSVPPARENQTAVYDPVSNRMIIFGGVNDSGILNDVWVLSNANGVSGTPTWTQLSPSGTGPSARAGSTATYDPLTNRMTLFAGNDEESLFNDLWVLSNANGVSGTPAWTELQPSGTLPGARSELGAAFNPFTNQMVIFGGSSSDSQFNDTWVLTNASGPLVITSNTLPTGSTQLPYSANPSVRSGNAPYTWSVNSGSLPPGLTLDPATGAITGTPTSAGSFSVGLQVADNSSPQQTANQTFTVTVTAPIAPNFQQYTIPTANSSPGAITSGPDGALWFVEYLGNNVGRISTSGAITEYQIPTAQSDPEGIVTGPDGALWFTEFGGDNIGQITTAGAISEYSLESDPPTGIASGPDGALWFAEWDTYYFGRIATSGAVMQFEMPSTEENPSYTQDTAAGPDGALWFTDPGNNEIGQITTSGVVTEFPIPTASSSPSGIAAGGDGALWFTESNAGANKIGRITTAGVITEFQIPTANSTPSHIVAGTDDALWFTEGEGGKIGRITTAGVITEFAIPAGGFPNGIAPGPDGALWFTSTANTVGRLSLVGALGLGCPISAGAQVGAAYSASCTPSGGNSPYTYSIIAGTLPPGLSVNTSTGAITGMPTSAGSFSFTVQVTDSSSPTQVATYVATNFIVQPPTLALGCVTAPSAQVGTPYSETCTASGGTPSYVFAISTGTLPRGLSLSGTGIISGTPSRSGTYSFSVQVTDSGLPAQVSAQTLSITVAPPPLAIRTTAAPNGTLGLAYSFTLLPRSGTAPYTWSITSGTLPAGLHLNSSAGSITGTATAAGAFSFAIKIADSSIPAQAASQSFSISIVAGLTITTTALPNGTAGIPYSTSLAVQSGTAPYTWSISTGVLPSGLALNAATGAITGTPTAAGSFPLPVKVTDSSVPTAQSITQPLSVYINPPMTTPVIPTLSLCTPSNVSTCSSLPATQPPEQAIHLAAELSEPTSVAVQGTVTLAFAANAADLPAGYMDPALQFVDSNGQQLGTTYNVTIPAATTSVMLPNVQPGTVAGAITITLTINGHEAAASTITVQPLAPVIEANSVQITNVTATGFDVELIANSTPRDMKTATLTFTAAPGTQITGTTTFSLDISSALAQWYSSAESQSYGSLFSVAVPFTFSGNLSAIQSVSIILTNSIGASSPVTGTP